jgi:hypothetical protein
MDKPEPKGPNDADPPLNSSGGRVRTRPAPATATPPEAATGESDPSSLGSSNRGLRRRRATDGPGAGTARTGTKPPPSSLAALGKPRAPRVWLRRLGVALLLLAVAAGGGLAFWHLVWVPRQAAVVLGELAKKPSPVPKPLPAVPAPPALYLPARPKAAVLPRAYRTEPLGQEEAALRKLHRLQTPPKATPWCDGFRPLREPLATTAGYKFASGKVCELIVRYAPTCPYSGPAALERAVTAYGPPAGQYTYRADTLLHTVQFWDDGKTMLKLDSRQDGPDTRLHALQLLDKATSLERAIQK